MKKLLFLGAALILPTLLATSAIGQETVRDSKDKNHKDKSKPVRRALEAWYERNEAAFEAKDVAAVMALRTDDFHTLTPDGKTNTRADMEARTKSLLSRIERFVSQENEIGTIEIEGDLASAEVSQHLVRLQRFPDGTVHTVETRVKQRETWRKAVDDSWKLYRVDEVRPGTTLVDGAPPAAPGS